MSQDRATSAGPLPGAGPAAGAAAAARRPAPPGGRRSGPADELPGLALVDRRSLRSARVRRALFAVTMSVVVIALFAVGLIHAQLVQRQHRLDELRAEIGDTQAERLRLSRQVVVASSPEEVVRRAREIGMVRAEDPVYLVAVRPVELR